MVTATAGARCAAFLISDWCPACRYPMVGTSASSPSTRASWHARRKSCALVTTARGISSSSLSGDRIELRLHFAGRRREAVLLGRELAVADLVAEAHRRVADQHAEVEVLLDELRRE